MALLFSEVDDLLDKNYTQIEPNTSSKNIGDWAERQEGEGSESKFIISVWDGSDWDDKFVLTQ